MQQMKPICSKCSSTAITATAEVHWSEFYSKWVIVELTDEPPVCDDCGATGSTIDRNSEIDPN